MTLTGAAIREAVSSVPGAIAKTRPQVRSFDELAAGAVDAFRQVPDLTPDGAACFLAQCTIESDYFRTTTEYGAAKSRYAPYVGRGFIQVTWRENYAKFGKWCADRKLLADPNHFVNNPTALSDLRWAWLGATWYFAANGLWKWANRGDNDAVSRAVNGGLGRVDTPGFIPNGNTHRQKMYAIYRRVGVMPADHQLVTEDDDMPTAREIADAILDTPIVRQGTAIPTELRGGKTTLRNEVAWLTNAMIHAPWSEPGAGAALVKRVEQLATPAAGATSSPADARALATQLGQVEQRLTDAIERVRIAAAGGHPISGSTELVAQAADLADALTALGPLTVTVTPQNPGA